MKMPLGTEVDLGPRPRPQCIRRCPSCPRKGHSMQPPCFRPMSIVATVAHLSYCWALVQMVSQKPKMRVNTTVTTSAFNVNYKITAIHASNTLTVSYKSSTVTEMGDTGHNRHGPKRGGAAVTLSLGAAPAASPSYAMWPGPRPTSVYQVAS